MVTMESFAQAFGFDAKPSDTWTTLGKVTAVSGNTLSVKLGGSSTATDCEAYCVAGVGDIVFVVVTNGAARAVATKGHGIGNVESDSTSTAQSITSGSTKTIASVSLAKGTWLVMGHTNFASNATGTRTLAIKTGTGFTNSDMSTVTVSATNGAETRMNTMAIVQPTTTTTYNLNAYQNSGDPLDAKTAVITAVKIG